MAGCLAYIKSVSRPPKHVGAALRRRDNRLETYKKAIDLLDRLRLRPGDKDYDVAYELRSYPCAQRTEFASMEAQLASRQ
jgi:hypothetical protein